MVWHDFEAGESEENGNWGTQNYRQQEIRHLPAAALSQLLAAAPDRCSLLTTLSARALLGYI